MDCETFEIIGRYEMDRGKQDKHYDFWWNLPQDYMGKNIQTMDFGENYQMALEIRPAHDPAKSYGFCGVVVDTTNLQGAIFTWWRDDDGVWQSKKTITIDPRPEDPDNLPELLKGFGAVPPLVTDIDLSLDDKYLYVACWGLGEMHQYDVSDPMNPVLAGKVEMGGIARGTDHPNGKPFVYGPRWSWPITMKTASIWTRIFMWSSQKATAPTKSGWKGATALPTASATRTSNSWKT